MAQIEQWSKITLKKCYYPQACLLAMFTLQFSPYLLNYRQEDGGDPLEVDKSQLKSI